MPDSIRRNYQEREPASNAGQMDGEERKGKERKGKEQFGTEFVVMKLSKLSKIIINTL
jgi:hypothetical protein